MNDRIIVRYDITQGDPEKVAEAIRVEQTIEFPFDLAPQWIQNDVVGRIESVDGTVVRISYDPGVTGGQVAQFLNVLWGNVSLFEGVRITDVEVPADLFPGPRFGIQGLRERFAAPHRPLLATALKPMGSSPDTLAGMAGVLARAGFDLIKDDHSLGDQPWARWHERVTACSAAVAQANEATGGRSAYLPTLNVPIDRVLPAAHEAKRLGCGGVLVLPGLTGFDTMRALAADDELDLPIMAHPSFLGAHVVNRGQGLDHGVLFGTVMRLAGADISIFPNYGGRFAFSQEECRQIQQACIAPLGGVAPIWPSPGGGITLDRVDELLAFYGSDVVLLVGGALHRGDLATNAEALVATVHDYPDS